MNEITALRLVKIEELKLEQNEILAKEAGVRRRLLLNTLTGIKTNMDQSCG